MLDLRIVIVTEKEGAESKKWMPAGMIIEGNPPIFTEIELKERFNTQEEADNFIIEIYKKQGYEINRKQQEEANYNN